MTIKSVLLLFLFSASAVLAGHQSPLGGWDDAKCLLSSAGTAEANYRTCCSRQKGGKAFVDGVQFEYLCDHFPTGTLSAKYHADSAHECARRCTVDPACAASGWIASQQRCYLSIDENYNTVRMEGWLLLAKTGQRTDPPPACGAACQQQRVNTARAQYRQEAAETRQVEWEWEQQTARILAFEAPRKQAEDGTWALQQRLLATCRDAPWECPDVVGTTQTVQTIDGVVYTTQSYWTWTDHDESHPGPSSLWECSAKSGCHVVNDIYYSWPYNRPVEHDCICRARGLQQTERSWERRIIQNRPRFGL
ncbi:hypothetical protein VTN77DRAFT_134 [Rasamsonia byssochlamydoides]|uniref:uncharacterized protein n=1 Tax=Rasamsonia byssochlamydoides TaxID=89139 RepID=UPI00374208BA